MPETNGNVKWRDLQDCENRFREALKDLDRQTAERLRSAHGFHTDLNHDMLTKINGLEGRVDRLESVIDQLRGARNLVYALMGTNVLLAAAAVWAMFGQ